MEIYGDLDSSRYSFWALQVHTCEDEPRRRSESDIAREEAWSSVHSFNDEKIYGLETCKTYDEISSFFDSNLLNLYANNTQVDNLIE
jgi:hypothetical protein